MDYIPVHKDEPDTYNSDEDLPLNEEQFHIRRRYFPNYVKEFLLSPINWWWLVDAAMLVIILVLISVLASTRSKGILSSSRIAPQCMASLSPLLENRCTKKGD